MPEADERHKVIPNVSAIHYNTKGTDENVHPKHQLDGEDQIEPALVC